MQRLPGVQIDRSQGRGTAVLIDGLRQNLTTLNGDVFLTGREFYVSGEASGGGAGSNAQYNSLEEIPSEEIGRIDVYKTPNAALTEGGLGGIIDLRSRDALSSPDGFSLAINVQGTSTSKGSLADATPNATIVASLRPSDTFAITGSVSYDDENTLTDEYESYNRSPWLIATSGQNGYTGVGPLTGADATPVPGGKSYLIPEYAYFSDLLDRRKVEGETAGLSWEPTNSSKTSLNFFFSQVQEQQTNYSVKVGFNGSGSSSGLPGINLNSPYSIDANGVVQSATFWLTGSETATLFQKSNSFADNIQSHTSWDNGGPLSATLDIAWAHANSNLQADQQDVEHGYYSAFGNATSAAPTAPGCNNFSPTCAPGSGNPAFEVQWANGGTSGLPSAVNLAPYADVLSNPNYTLFKSAWAWGNTGRQTQGAVRGALVYKPEFLAKVAGTITGGFRIATRDVDQTFGRYLIDGLTTGGAPIANCCVNPNGGTYLYYQDPGYAAIPYDTAVSNPSLVKTVNNFALGSIIVKNPITGGMTNPATFLNTVWNQAAHVPVGTAVPRQLGEILRRHFEFVPGEGNDGCRLSDGGLRRDRRPFPRQRRRSPGQDGPHGGRRSDGTGADLLRHRLLERRQQQQHPGRQQETLLGPAAVVERRAQDHG